MSTATSDDRLKELMRSLDLLTSRILWLESEIRRATWQRDELTKEAEKVKA